MKCIYCNTEEEMTVSDVIPWALTGAKVKKRFVCIKHNTFTNDNYEKIFISNLGFFRNNLGLTERDGDPVRFKGTLHVDGCSFENQTVTNRESIVAIKKRILSTKNDENIKVLMGDERRLCKIKGVKKDNIHLVDLSDMAVETKIDLVECFISIRALHVIAKIAYEWHCYINRIDGYDEGRYRDIVSYILNPTSEAPLVEIVTDKQVWNILDTYSHTGSNILFEYDDQDGYKYVVFSLWNSIAYRIKICISDSKYGICSIGIYYYNVDGTQHFCSIISENKLNIKTDLPEEGLSIVYKTLVQRLGKLGERDISYDYIKTHVEKIKKDLLCYKKDKGTFENLLEYEAEDRVIVIYILELLAANKTYGCKEKSFQKVLSKIIQTDNLSISNQEKIEILHKYKRLDEEGKLCTMIEEGISIFEYFEEP